MGFSDIVLDTIAPRSHLQASLLARPARKHEIGIIHTVADRFQPQYPFGDQFTYTQKSGIEGVVRTCTRLCLDGLLLVGFMHYTKNQFSLLLKEGYDKWIASPVWLWRKSQGVPKDLSNKSLLNAMLQRAIIVHDDSLLARIEIPELGVFFRIHGSKSPSGGKRKKVAAAVASDTPALLQTA